MNSQTIFGIQSTAGAVPVRNEKGMLLYLFIYFVLMNSKAL